MNAHELCGHTVFLFLRQTSLDLKRNNAQWTLQAVCQHGQRQYAA